MYDGVDATRLPTSAQLVAGYVDGLYAWSAANWARFPNSVKVRVAVFSQTNDGQVLDVEPGNATPAQSVDWVLMRRRAGVDPTVYMNTSTWPTVRGSFQARGVAEPHYWVAQYDGIASIPAGAVAKQYYNNNDLGYDLSIVAAYWPGIDPAPQPPIAAPSEENDMILTDIKGSSVVWALSGSLYWPVADVESIAAYRAARITEVTITQAEHQAILAAAAKAAAASTAPVTGT